MGRQAEAYGSREWPHAAAPAARTARHCAWQKAVSVLYCCHARIADSPRPSPKVSAAAHASMSTCAAGTFSGRRGAQAPGGNSSLSLDDGSSAQAGQHRRKASFSGITSMQPPGGTSSISLSWGGAGGSILARAPAPLRVWRAGGRRRACGASRPGDRRSPPPPAGRGRRPAPSLAACLQGAAAAGDPLPGHLGGSPQRRPPSAGRRLPTADSFSGASRAGSLPGSPYYHQSNNATGERLQSRLQHTVCAA